MCNPRKLLIACVAYGYWLYECTDINHKQSLNARIGIGPVCRGLIVMPCAMRSLHRSVLLPLSAFYCALPPPRPPAGLRSTVSIPPAVRAPALFFLRRRRAVSARLFM